MNEPTPEDISRAGAVLKAVKQVDPYFVNADLAIARGWAMIFAKYDYTLEEMLEGVLDFYTHETKGAHCMPANVIQGAKRARERLASQDRQYKAQLEQRRNQRRDQRDAQLAAVNGRPQLEPAGDKKLRPDLAAMLANAAERKRI
mgnify:CR=1 FL=1